MKRLAVPVAALLMAAVFLVPVAASAPCDAPQRRQFDFWVGRWDVYSKVQSNKLLAHSRIETLYRGCAIRENWMPLSGNHGGSLNAYAPGAKSWKQFWTDAQGGSAEFTGGWNGKAMVLTGIWPQPGHPKQITRMTYTPLAGGSVEQQGVTSDDGGKTWTPSFDLIYRRAK